MHSLVMVCFRSMAANTLRKAVPSRRAFKSKASAACGSDCGKIRSCVPRSGETMLVDSRKWIRCSQDSSVFGGAALTKSTESRPPSNKRGDRVSDMEETSLQYQNNRPQVFNQPFKLIITLI